VAGKKVGGERQDSEPADVTDMWRLYERHAAEFDRARGCGLMERGYLTAVLDRLPAAADILDIGCGVGQPIARFFIEHGINVTGIDAAPAMLAICRQRFPHATWIEADMRGLDLGRRFDAIVAWDSFFHLDAGEQRAMFEVFARHAAPGATLLFTSGPEAGVVIGDLYGEELFHASLAREEYRGLLKHWGFEVLRYRESDADCGAHTVWLARFMT
jgi:SAM-dependent methyltransferase